MVKTPLKELAAATGFSRNYCAKLRMRGMNDDQIINYRPANNHGNKGDWGDLPKRSFLDQERILDGIPGPTRYDEIFG